MYTPISYRELDQFAGEVLPERTVLSTVSDFSGGSDDGTTVVYTCQTTYNPGTPGLLGVLGLGQGPTYTQTCTPTAITSS